MAFTYEPKPDVGQVRFRIGDKVDAGHLLEDEEIQALLFEQGSVLAASVVACEGIAAAFSREIDFSTDDQKFERQKRADAFRKLAAQLREAGGGSIATLETSRTDGFTDGIGNEQSIAAIVGGRIRAGYVDPD